MILWYVTICVLSAHGIVMRGVMIHTCYASFVALSVVILCGIKASHTTMGVFYYNLLRYITIQYITINYVKLGCNTMSYKLQCIMIQRINDKI